MANLELTQRIRDAEAAIKKDAKKRPRVITRSESEI